MTSPSDPPAVAADYFDGRSARVHPVTLFLDGETLVLAGEAIERRDLLASLRVSEPMGAAPRLISYPDGAHCEVRDHESLAQLLAASGHRDGLVVRLQTYWQAAAAAVLVSVAALAAGYFWGLPAVSEWAAMHTPGPVLAQLGKSTLGVLDRAVMEPSALPETRQRQLSAAFDRMVVPGGVKPQYRILFRKGAGIGANALALPDGTIVMTDELVELAAHDEEILAVLAHELGHISHRHSLRMLIQGSIVAFVVSWYMGDVSSIAAGLPTLLLQARYSREHEAESDRYAAIMLKANGVSPKRLGDMLASLEQAHRMQGKGGAQEKDEGQKGKVKRGEVGKGNDGQQRDGPGGTTTDSKGGRVNDYLATHPATTERIEALGR